MNGLLRDIVDEQGDCVSHRSVRDQCVIATIRISYRIVVVFILPNSVYSFVV